MDKNQVVRIRLEGRLRVELKSEIWAMIISFSASIINRILTSPFNLFTILDLGHHFRHVRTTS